MVLPDSAVIEPPRIVGAPRVARDDIGGRERTLARARDLFVRTRRIASDVRPEIAASWQRSVLCGVSPALASPEYAPDVSFDGQLTRVARPVLEEREIALAQTNCGIVLTDADACVLARWGSDSEFEYELTADKVLPGFCLAESVMGTNSAALALELGEPCEVHGAEHLAADFVDYSSAGAPIVHPVSRRLMGTLNVTCRSADATPLLMPWLLEVIREIERRLRTQGCVHEQVLLESYLSAKRDCRHPIVCLNQQTILSNSAAARLLGTVDQALLWEQASRAIHDRVTEVTTFVLTDGQHVSARCHPIFDGLSPVGAKIEIQLNQSPKAATRRTGASAGERLESLAGHGVRWQKLCADVTAAKALPVPLLLVGEAGTGKLAVARALFDNGEADVFDAALQAVEADGEWIRRLNARLQNPGGIVILRHLEALGAFTSQTVASLIDGAPDGGPRIVGTLTTSDGAPQLLGSPLEALSTIVTVPALRDRLEDLRELLQALTDRHASGAGAWQWMPDAIQTLSRIDWPSNVRGLEFIIKQVVCERAPGYVDARSLPASVRAAGSRRRLSRLEQVEAAAITDAMQRSRGNKLEAAEKLGIARSTLYRRMRSLGLDLTEANY